MGLHPVEILMGEAGGAAGDCSPAVRDSFNYMRAIVTAGWSIYPPATIWLPGGICAEALLNGSVLKLSSTLSTPGPTPRTRSPSCSLAGPLPSLSLRAGARPSSDRGKLRSSSVSSTEHPLIECNLILKAAQVPSECFWRLFLATVVILAFRLRR